MLKTFYIGDVEEGMSVDSLVKQQGKFKITNRGRVTSLAAIEHLKNRGILSVVVNMSKQIKLEVVAHQEPELVTEKTTEPPEEISFEAELGVAIKLHLKGKHLQKTMLESLGQNLPIDIAIPEAFTKSHVASIERNSNALMCMTKIREKGAYLLEYLLNVAKCLSAGNHYITA